MRTEQSLKADEPSAIILRGNTWAYNFLVFALFIDIMYRSLVFHEAAWDLFVVLFASGVVSMVYAARHNVLVLNRKTVILMVLGPVVAAVVAVILAMTKAM
jgi:hypothetical protein